MTPYVAVLLLTATDPIGFTRSGCTLYSACKPPYRVVVLPILGQEILAFGASLSLSSYREAALSYHAKQKEGGFEVRDRCIMNCLVFLPRNTADRRLSQ